MKQLFLVLLIVVLYALHQDVWFWRTASPLLFGFLPVGITYHVCFTLAVSALMGLLVKVAWPKHLENVGEKKSETTPPPASASTPLLSESEDAAS